MVGGGWASGMGSLLLVEVVVKTAGVLLIFRRDVNHLADFGQEFSFLLL